MLRFAAAFLRVYYRLFLFLGTRSTTKMITAAAMARAMRSPVKRKPFSLRSSINVSPVDSGVVVMWGSSIEDDSGIFVVVIGAVVGGVTVVSSAVPRGPSVLEMAAVPLVAAGEVVPAKTVVPNDTSKIRRTKNESKRNPLACDMVTDPFVL